MTRTTVIRTIRASAAHVFDVVAHIENFANVAPDIVEVEFLSESKTGIGTRFRETRSMNGRVATTELEVTEYRKDERVRIVSDTHGTIWDTVFTVTADGDSTRLTMVMDANAYKLLPKIVNPFIKGMVKKAIEKDMDAVKSYCESVRA